MYYLADQDTARRVLADLRGARLGERDDVIATLRRLRNEVASDRMDDRSRIQAWIAIRDLYDVFKAPSGRDLKPFWQDAIDKMVAWQDGMR